MSWMREVAPFDALVQKNRRSGGSVDGRSVDDKVRGSGGGPAENTTTASPNVEDGQGWIIGLLENKAQRISSGEAEDC